MEIIVKGIETANAVIHHANNYDIPAFVIGHTEKAKSGCNSVKIGSCIYTK